MVRVARSLAVAMVVLLLAAQAGAQDRAQQLLAQAREALGDKKATSAVTSLSATASVRRVAKMFNREIPSEVQLDLLLPDKYRRSESMNMGVMTVELTVAMNGDKLFYDDGGMAKMAGVDPMANETQRQETLKGLRQDLFRLFTVWLFTPPSQAPFTVSYAGVAEAPDGKADVLEVKGPDEVSLRLFLDTTTHRLLMATQQTKTVDAAQVKALTEKMTKDMMASGGANPAELGKQIRDEIAKLPKKDVTVEMHFSDYKAVNGVLLPHHMTTDVPDQVQEEWTISSFKVNPTLKPERFEKK